MADSRNWFQGRRVLVLGGTGFMGQYLVSALVRLDADVTILTNNRPVPEAIASLARLGSTRIRIRQGDVCNHSVLMDLVAGQQVIYALAGKSGAVQSNNNPVLDLNVNCGGLLNLLECCRVSNPSARIVFPSSRLVYGKVDTLPVPESHPTKPTSIYAIHKLTGEKYLVLYHQLYNLPTMVLRITNPYGLQHQPAQFTHGIINAFFQKALQGEPLTIFGDGHQIRDYIYIEDVVQAFLMAGKRPEAVGQVFNVGSGQGVSLAEVAEAIVRLVGRGFVQYQAWPPDHLLVETGDFIADIGKIRAALGWSPRTEQQQGLRKVYRDWLLYSRS